MSYVLSMLAIHPSVDACKQVSCVLGSEFCFTFLAVVNGSQGFEALENVAIGRNNYQNFMIFLRTNSRMQKNHMLKSKANNASYVRLLPRRILKYSLGGDGAKNRTFSNYYMRRNFITYLLNVVLMIKSNTHTCLQFTRSFPVKW